jgi:hypothetical protein
MPATARPTHAHSHAESSYLVFNTRDHIETLTRHFDDLVLNDSVLSQSVAAWLVTLARPNAALR